jgi:hypothetical protein
MGGRQDELLILLLLFDPLQDPNNLEAYMYSNIFLPDINNEREDKDSSYADNLASLTRLVLYRFEDDTTGVRELHNSSAGPFSCVDLRSAVCVTCKLRGILKACCWNRGGCWLIACPRLGLVGSQTRPHANGQQQQAPSTYVCISQCASSKLA